MPDSPPIAWGCAYGDPVLDASFSKLELTHSFGSPFSWGVHTFSAAMSASESKGSDPFTDTVVKALEDKASSLSFYIESMGGHPKRTGTKHHHMLVSWHANLSMGSAAEARTRMVTAITMEKRLVMALTNAGHSYQNEDLTDTVKAVVQGRGLQWDGELAEGCPAAPEFGILIQPIPYSYHQFIEECVKPRAVTASGHGGLNLVSKDGRKVGWCTPDFQARTLTVEPHEVIQVAETTAPLPLLDMGGLKLSVLGYDPRAIQSLEGSASGPARRFTKGDHFLPPEAGSTIYHPLRSQAAVQAWAKAVHDSVAWPAAFSVKMFGSDVYGKEKEKPLPNLKVDLSGTKYRRRDGQIGVVLSAYHLLEGTKYHCTLYCGTNRVSY